MLFPADLQFSQASLQDFVDCPRRFHLRYVLRVAWPAVAAEPVEEYERHQQWGLTFHRMVQQHLVGIPEARLSPLAADPDLERWWRNYCVYRPVEMLPDMARYPEITLTAALGERRLLAKYDLIVVQPGQRAVIFDWKTSPTRTKPLTLKARLQTRVYRYLLARAGAHLNAGQPLDPAQIEMIYWFAEHPEAPVRLPYDAAQYHDDEVYLTDLIEQILSLNEDAFTLTEDERRCAYCPYRSYCDRGIKAGILGEDEDESTENAAELRLSFDFEQIAEIAF
ncbi:MAG TPA: PD-(D/E)XK nuclease family protein [Anaerolineae bacterium]|nr:PD-(D/E)XK nuclease family protein [Anaerolineae bacterium]HQI87326.1 PD-(D/E)XK nuclease family protein [Anaerolineae bacterium]